LLACRFDICLTSSGVFSLLVFSLEGNAEFYCSQGLPFVMGTTGGDRNKLVKDVEASGVYAVIAPQMGKQVVAFQAAMELMAEQFPGAFAGYTLQVTESHQSSKVDTSGTAKAVISSFQKLGLPFNLDQVGLLFSHVTMFSQLHLHSLLL
jgi:4-hydroxy-tetrahydrodipicolinate reductase